MQAHLLRCKFGDSLSKRIGLNKLEMLMLVLEEFQKTYTVASIYRGIFTKAIQQIVPGYSAPKTPFSTAAAPIAAPGTENYGRGSLLEGENIDANNSENNPLGDFGFAVADETFLTNDFLDEASIFGFWQTWNQI